MDKPAKSTGSGEPRALARLSLEHRIHAVRGVLVMLDRDLAELYGVETKVLNQAVKRNIERFPEDFTFQLTEDEMEALRCQSGTSDVGDEAGTGALRSQTVTSNAGRLFRCSQIPREEFSPFCARWSSRMIVLDICSGT